MSPLPRDKNRFKSDQSVLEAAGVSAAQVAAAHCILKLNIGNLKIGDQGIVATAHTEGGLGYFWPYVSIANCILFFTLHLWMTMQKNSLS